MDACFFHPNNSEVTSCSECTRGICERCIRRNKRKLCMDCARSRRLGRLARAGALVLLMVGLLSGVAWQRSGDARAAQCGVQTARGTAEIRFDPLSHSIVVSARVNGARGRFLLDTGASLVALSREFAEQAGVDGTSGAPIRVRTANGVSLARLTRLDALALQGATAEGVEAAVIDGLPEHVDGLLGLSFLARFELHLDMDEGRLSLAARGR